MEEKVVVVKEKVVGVVSAARNAWTPAAAAPSDWTPAGFGGAKRPRGEDDDGEEEDGDGGDGAVKKEHLNEDGTVMSASRIKNLKKKERQKKKKLEGGGA